MQIINCRHNLSEEFPCFFIFKAFLVIDVIVEFSTTCVLHHKNNLFLIFVHWKETSEDNVMKVMFLQVSVLSFYLGGGALPIHPPPDTGPHWKGMVSAIRQWTSYWNVFLFYYLIRIWTYFGILGHILNCLLNRTQNLLFTHFSLPNKKKKNMFLGSKYLTIFSPFKANDF